MQTFQVIALSSYFLIVLVLTVLALRKIFRTFSHTMRQGIEKPPLNLGRVIAEILVGGILGGLIGIPLSIPGTVTLFLFNFLSGFVGGSVGVYLVGTRGNETGSFLATWAGGALGIFGATTFSVVELAPRMLPHSALQESGERMTMIIAVFIPVLGATIGFNMTRRYKLPPVNGV